MELKQGQAFGRYTIESVLGEGAMGRVYRASDATLLRRVALKILTTHEEDGVLAKDVAAKILREARAAAAISHENAVTIFDVGEVDGVPYIAMEYVGGTPLRSFVGDAAVSMGDRLRWLSGVARALGAAHDRGLVHRDVKPENILVRKDGVVKVLDFGIARSQSSTQFETAATTMPMLASRTDVSISGTPAYMAPEQLRGEEIDGRCDQFAWGLVAYELTSGTYPFRSTQLMPLIGDILTLVPKPPDEIEPRVPPHVSAVIMRALAKDSKDRFPSMQDLLRGLGEVGTGPFAAQALGSAPGSSPRSAPAAPPSSGFSLPEALAVTQTGGAPLVKERQPQSSKKGMLVVAAGLLVAATAAVGTQAFRARRGPSEVAIDSPPHSSSSMTPVTSLEAPRSSRLDAVAAYRAGLQATRDGAGGIARAQFAHAAELDPTMASANVMFTALSVFQSRTAARAAIDRAREQRASLSERDKLLLASLEPLLDRDPADLVAAENILVAGLPRFPGDAHLHLQLAIYRSARGLREALVDADLALAIDPEYTAARLIRALVLESLGSESEALEAYEACTAANPTSASCLAGKLKLRARRGECALVLTEAKRWTTALPADSEGYRHRAIFSASRIGSDDVIGTLLERSRSFLSEGQRARRELVDALGLALLGGDFVAARDLAKKLLALGGREGGVGENSEAALALMEVSEELGNDREAGDVAKAFLDRRDLWIEAARIDQDPTPVFVAKARRLHLLSDVQAEEQGHAWQARWASRGRLGEKWLIQHASAAETKTEALSALAELRGEPLPALPDLRLSLALGRTYLLAGRVDDAIGPLERAVEDCGVLRAPVAHVRAAALLGDAFVAKGEHDKACTAYGKVLSRWKEKGAGVTYHHALSAARKERCKASP